MILWANKTHVLKQDDHYRQPQWKTDGHYIIVWPLIRCQYPAANFPVKSLGCVTIKLVLTKKSWSLCGTVILAAWTSNFAGYFQSNFFDRDGPISSTYQIFRNIKFQNIGSVFAINNSEKSRDKRSSLNNQVVSKIWHSNYRVSTVHVYKISRYLNRLVWVLPHCILKDRLFLRLCLIWASLQTTKAQTSLHIHSVWSAPLS